MSRRKPQSRLLPLLLLAALALPALEGPARAQADAPSEAGSGAEDEPPSPLEKSLASLERSRTHLSLLADYLRDAQDPLREAIVPRARRARVELMEEVLAFADLAVAEEGGEAARARARAVELLRDNLAVAQEIWASLTEDARAPDPDIAPADQAAEDRDLLAREQLANRVLAATDGSLERLAALGVDVAELTERFRRRLLDRTIAGFAYLALAEEQVATARARLGVLPDDAELAARLRVARARVQGVASLLKPVVERLDRHGVETAVLKAQLLAATGDVSTGIFDLSVLDELLSRWGREVRAVISERGPGLLLKLLLFVVIALVAWRLSRFTRRLVELALKRSGSGLSELLRRMIVSMAASLVLGVGFLIALSQLGISLGPLLAGLGIAGLVIGFALQDSLSNFAAGMLILFYRPFDVGDIVEIGGVSGTVEAMSLVNSTIHTFDNQRIVMPNTMIWGGIIKNVTAQSVRRVDMVFGIAYGDDVEHAERILKEIAATTDAVLDDPEPIVRLHELGDSSVNFVVRPWTKTQDYWNVYWDVTRAVKLRFDEEGISIPFPQRDVHLIAEGQPVEGASD